MKTRYVAVIDFYVYADNDQQAEEKAKAICKELRNKDDNHATLQELVEQPFGVFGNRPIEINKIEITNI